MGGGWGGIHTAEDLFLLLKHTQLVFFADVPVIFSDFFASCLPLYYFFYLRDD